MYIHKATCKYTFVNTNIYDLMCCRQLKIKKDVGDFGLSAGFESKSSFTIMMRENRKQKPLCSSMICI